MALPKSNYRVIADAVKTIVEAEPTLFNAQTGPIKKVDTELKGDLATYPQAELPVFVVRPDGKRETGGDPRALEREYRFAGVVYARSGKLEDIAAEIQDIAQAIEDLITLQWDADRVFGIASGELTGYEEPGSLHPELIDTDFVMGQYLRQSKRVGDPWQQGVAGLWFVSAEIKFNVTYVASIDVN